MSHQAKEAPESKPWEPLDPAKDTFVGLTRLPWMRQPVTRKVGADNRHPTTPGS